MTTPKKDIPASLATDASSTGNEPSFTPSKASSPHSSSLVTGHGNDSASDDDDDEDPRNARVGWFPKPENSVAQHIAPEEQEQWKHFWRCGIDEGYVSFGIEKNRDTYHVEHKKADDDSVQLAADFKLNTRMKEAHIEECNWFAALDGHPPLTAEHFAEEFGMSLEDMQKEGLIDFIQRVADDNIAKMKKYEEAQKSKQ